MIYVFRKLEEIDQELVLFVEQGETAVFPPNIENTQKINDLVEDIRQVAMEYQVRAWPFIFFAVPNG